MILKEHKCKECGSDNFELYKNETTVYIKCEKCGSIQPIYNFKKIPEEIKKIKEVEKNTFKSIFPTVLAILLFTVVFAFAIRFIDFTIGVGL